MTDYRYTLTRQITGPLANDATRRLCWVMLNPSTADDLVDDPTIRRVIRFTKDAGYTDLSVVNLFAARTTRPVHLTEMDDPVGPANGTWQFHEMHRADAVVFAWGAWYRSNVKKFPRRLRRLDQELIMEAHDIILLPTMCLGMTGEGSPRHPLYVPANQPLVAA